MQGWFNICKSIKVIHHIITKDKSHLSRCRRRVWQNSTSIYDNSIKLLDISLTNIFLCMSPQASSTKAKVQKKKKKMGLHWTKKLLYSKGKPPTLEFGLERQFTEWEKGFTNDVSDKGLISKIHKEFIQTSKRQTTQDFPRGPVARTPRSQCRGPRLDPWSGKHIPCAATKAQCSQKDIFKKLQSY